MREGFLSLTDEPSLAGCAGGFALPALIGLAGPACGRAGGDDGSNPTGQGCNAEDLCASGWHLCRDRLEVAARSATGCAGILPAGSTEVLFFATGQRSIGGADCNDLGQGANDLYGCGSLGAAANANCQPLDRYSSHLCRALDVPWNCDRSPNDEATGVVKPGAAAGGVLCCRD